MQLCSSLSVLWHCLSLGLEQNLVILILFFPQCFSTFASSLTSPSQNDIHQVLICFSLLFFHWASASQVVLVVKNPPTSVRDIRNAVQSLGWEDPLGGHASPPMTTHSSILAWRILWGEEPHRPQCVVSQSWT